MGSNFHDYRKDLINSLKPYVVNKHVVLASGGESDYYVDVKSMLLTSDGLMAAVNALWSYIKTRNIPVNSFGGIESGTIGLASVLCYLFHYPAFYVRKKQNDHGLEKMIEGHVVDPCIVLEDVWSTGASAQRSVNVLESAGHTVSAVISLVHRGQTPVLSEPYHSLVTARELRDESVL